MTLEKESVEVVIMLLQANANPCGTICSGQMPVNVHTAIAVDSPIIPDSNEELSPPSICYG